MEDNELWSEINKVQASSTYAPDVADVEAAKRFVKNWGTCQSNSIDMLEELLYLMGYEKESKYLWSNMN